MKIRRRAANAHVASIQKQRFKPSKGDSRKMSNEVKLKILERLIEILVQSVAVTVILDCVFKGMWARNRTRAQNQAGGDSERSVRRGAEMITAWVLHTFKSPLAFAKAACLYLLQQVRAKEIDLYDCIHPHLLTRLRNDFMDTINARLNSVAINVKLAGRMSYRLFDAVRRSIMKDYNPVSGKWEKWVVRCVCIMPVFSLSRSTESPLSPLVPIWARASCSRGRASIL
jgi:hypothetical protein